MQSNEGQGSRRDDVMSLFYCLVYMANGTLPWVTTIDANDDDTVAILAVK